jgi:trehalose/maltose hydrolase-like predicted phosphorylase
VRLLTNFAATSIAVALALPCASADSNPATADSFEFSTQVYSAYHPTLLGNGYLFGATSWNGAASSPATLSGLYDHLQLNSYIYQAQIPSWNGVDYWNGYHWLNGMEPESAQLNGYKQTLDAHSGVLTTRYDWQDKDRSTRVEVTTFPSRQEGRLGVVRIRITPGYGVEAGPVTFSFPLGGAPGEHFTWEGAELPGTLPIRKVEADTDGAGFVATSETRDGGLWVSEAVRVTLPGSVPRKEVSLGLTRGLARPALNIKFIVRKGETYTFTKYVAAVASGEPDAPAEKARAIAAAAERQGYESILQGHEKAWRSLWTTDILIQGDVEAQRAVHAAMFYLFSSLRQDVNGSLPAVALPSRAYLGRVWWDADTWVFPSLLVLHPELARSVVNYRSERLEAARKNAESRGFRGALYPMESGATGQEEAPEWSSEIHVTGDVAMAQWRYFQETGDLSWLRQSGYPVLAAVADFWASRVAFNKDKDVYEIRQVTGPNESIIHVDDDAYTNAVARRSLEVASEAARLLGEKPDPDWERIAAKITIPFDARGQHHLEHGGDTSGQYAHALILLTYPLEMDFPAQVKRNDLQECLRNFGKPGYEVGMLGNFYSVVASELGDRDLAYKLFLSMLRSYAKPPFYAMSETPGNNRFVFMTAEGAFLQQVIFGFTGLRFSEEGLTRKYPPLLPGVWQSLDLRGVNVKGKRYDIRVGRDGTLTMAAAKP